MMISLDDGRKQFGFPESEIMMNCINSIEETGKKTPLGTYICINEGPCTCVRDGQVAESNYKPGFKGLDSIDKLVVD